MSHVLQNKTRRPRRHQHLLDFMFLRNSSPHPPSSFFQWIAMPPTIIVLHPTHTVNDCIMSLHRILNALLVSVLLVISSAITVQAFLVHYSPRPAVQSSQLFPKLNPPILFPHSSLYPSKSCLRLSTQSQSNEVDSAAIARNYSGNGPFDLDLALFCGGLAFDVYTEPPKNSSRWERGSSGLNVAFASPAFTRSLYKGLLEVNPIRATNLPDEDSTAEGIITGGGTDAYLLVGIAEGKWKEDIEILEKQQFNEGVLDLQGCAHIGRSSTAWSNIDAKKASINKKKGGSGAYHIKSSWGKGGEAVWDSDPPFYLYVQEPSEARIILTVCDDNVVGDIDPIGSTYKKLVDLFPQAKAEDPVQFLKDAVLAKLKRGENITSGREIVAQEWSGVLPLTSKPRKKDKNSQIAAAVAAGAIVAGPAGAAVGGLLASFYEGEVRGSVEVKMRYLPLPKAPLVRKQYKPKGGLPGVDWGALFELKRAKDGLGSDDMFKDLEMCFFLTHDKTGCTCVCYRSLEKKMIAVSFRGTCQPVDLITDASLVQETWVEGEDINAENVRKVHQGFRTSLNSVSRKLKELILAAVAPGDDISQYDLIVTGHSLGGALSTLFSCDIAEFGIDAGRALPSKAKSEPWWNALNLFGKEAANLAKTSPPKPKSLKLYNFGSPRVGNAEFVEKFDSFVNNGIIHEAYRIVNGNDVVARLPRTFNAALFGSVGYEHAAPTVLISIPDDQQSVDSEPLLWIEGQSQGFRCPVRDGTVLTSPLARGSLLGDIAASIDSGNTTDYLNYISKLTDAVKERIGKFSAADIPSIVGIDKTFVEREAKIIQTIVSGEALGNHMEDQYYFGIGRACGFIALAGEEIQQIGRLKGDVIDLEKEFSKSNSVSRRPIDIDDTTESSDIWGQLDNWLKEKRS